MDESSANEHATFARMDQRTQRDWDIIQREMRPLKEALAERVLNHLRLLSGDYGGFAVDRFEHSLQTATRAHRDERDDEYVVCALLHDIGDTLGCYNHADVAAAILKPFVSEKNHWLVQKHAMFQGYHFFHFVGLDRNIRERYRGHPHFDYTAEFIDKYDQTSFEPEYDTMPLEAFEPMVQTMLARPRESGYVSVDE